MAPRDGSGIYSIPFPDVVEGTTIESAVYNGFTHDVEIDLNTPRPISVGGTGATNPVDAMAALGGEGSKIEVLNYDSHPFTAGSFYSKASATNPPVAAHAFAGICYVAVVSGVATSDMFIEVRDRDELTQPGSLFVRQKKAGVWSGWMKAVGTGMGATPPASPTDGMFWWDKTRGKLFVWYADVDTAQWVEAVAIPDTNTDEVQGIADATVAAKAVRYDVAQTLTAGQQAQARANIDVTTKNYIINGAMQVSQENAATAGTAFGYYPVDQFIVTYSNAGTQTSQQVVSFTPSGSPNRLRVTATVADAAVAVGDYLYAGTRIEGLRMTDLGFGKPWAKIFTLRFGVKAPAGTYCVAFKNGANDRVYVAEYVIAAGEANTDVVKTITITGDVTGTWATDNTAGVFIVWGLMFGTTYQSAAGSWGAGNFYVSSSQFNFMGTAGNVFELFDVGLYEGSVAPPFQVPDYADELALCQRYWQRYSSYVIPAVTDVYSTTPSPSMRIGPTLSGGGAGFAVSVNSSAGNHIVVYQTAKANITLVLNARM